MSSSGSSSLSSQSGKGGESHTQLSPGKKNHNSHKKGAESYEKMEEEVTISTNGVGKKVNVGIRRGKSRKDS